MITNQLLEDLNLLSEIMMPLLRLTKNLEILYKDGWAI